MDLSALVALLTHPFIAPLLIATGVVGLLIELKAGAHGIAGLVGVAAIGAFFAASVVAGLAGGPELILLVLGMVAIALEVFVLPGTGAAGVLGAAALVAAVGLAMLGPAPSAIDAMQALASLGAAAVIVAAVTYAWVRHLPSSGRFAGLLLRNAVDASEGFIAAPPREDLVGRDGVAVTDLRPSGTARFGEELLDVVTEGGFLAAGSPVRVVRSEGYRHVVRPAPALAGGALPGAST